MNCWKSLKGKVRFRESLKKHTTFKIGGEVRVFIEPHDPADLKLSLRLAKQKKIPVFVIGRGSNILAPDSGIKGVVLKLNTPFFKKLIFRKSYLEAGSGVLLSSIVSSCLKQGLSGAEFLSGIPGTLGGALAMNAGIARDERSIADLVKSVEVLDYRGNIRTLSLGDISFGYRKSSLSRYIILSARLKLKKDRPRNIRDSINNYLQFRRLTQDLSWPSAGCVFKNPEGESAGRLIDACGLKGRRVGGARVSLKHANFIINTGKARAADVRKLMAAIKKEVYMRFGIALEPEIKTWQN